jgi:hypothetical protein
MAHLYVLSCRAKAEQNIFKIGVHTGSMEALITRYITCIPDVQVHLFWPCRNARSVEKIIKAKSAIREVNVRGSKSEWIQEPLDSLVARIVLAQPETTFYEASELRTRAKKRKRDASLMPIKRAVWKWQSLVRQRRLDRLMDDCKKTNGKVFELLIYKWIKHYWGHTPAYKFLALCATSENCRFIRLCWHQYLASVLEKRSPVKRVAQALKQPRKSKYSRSANGISIDFFNCAFPERYGIRIAESPTISGDIIGRKEVQHPLLVMPFILHDVRTLQPPHIRNAKTTFFQCADAWATASEKDFDEFAKSDK